MPEETPSFFEKNQTRTIIIIVLVLFIVGILIWASIKSHQAKIPNQTNHPSLTEEQLQDIIKSTTAPGPDKLSEEERNRIIESTSGSGSSSMTAAGREEIVNSTTAK